MDVTTVNKMRKNKGGVNDLSANCVILESHWKDDDLFTMVDNLNRLINIRLSGEDPVQILTGHDVGEGVVFEIG